MQWPLVLRKMNGLTKYRVVCFFVIYRRVKEARGTNPAKMLNHDELVFNSVVVCPICTYACIKQLRNVSRVERCECLFHSSSCLLPLVGVGVEGPSRGDAVEGWKIMGCSAGRTTFF